MPLVSVIIPTYNRADYIVEAIESVFGQTHTNTEVIVIDDGSTDTTRDVLKPYIDAKRISYVHQAHSGVSKARNLGLKAARGTYIKFLDSDDFLYPDQIEAQIKDLNGAQDVLSITDFTVLKPNGEREFKEIYLVEKNKQLASFIESNRGVIHAFLTPKACLDKVGGFDESLESCEDLDLWIQILFQGAHARRLNINGCCYRILKKSLSADTEHMFLQKAKVYEKISRALLDKRIAQRDVHESIFKINNELLDECVARRMPLLQVLPYGVKLNTQMYHERKKGLFKILLRLLGLNHYLRLRHTFKEIKYKGYTEDLINSNYRWKYE